MRKALDLTGQTFGKLVVIGYAYTKNNVRFWRCKCKCGTIVEKRQGNLRSGDTQSCGCYRKHVSSMRSRKDLTGKRFGKLLATKIAKTNQRRLLCWECRCDCGNTTIVTSNDLLTGNTQSCGCYSKELASQRSSLRGKQTNNLCNHPAWMGIKNDWDYAHNVISPSQYGAGSHAKIWWVCHQCQYRWLAPIYSRINGNGCSRCNSSNGEKTISKILLNYNIPFKHQYYKIDLSDDMYAIPDFRIGSYYIEYNGDQHYKPMRVGRAGIKTPQEAQQRFDKQQKRDQLLRDKLGDKLIEVPYTIPFNEIKDFLDKEFQKRGVKLFG